MHAGVCRCARCTGVAGSGIGTALATVLLLLEAAGVVLVRFVTGRVLFRPVGAWDATYQHWAPRAPVQVTRIRGAGYPRTSWARRPGHHRQAVRLLTVLASVGLVLAPGLTAAALGGAALAAAGVAFAMTRDRAVPGQARVAPDPPRQYSDVPTANRTAVPPYVNPYLQNRNDPSNTQDRSTRVRATATRLDETTTREGRW